MKTFVELSREEKLELFAAWIDGKTIEIEVDPHKQDWRVISKPNWKRGCKYRVALTKPSINWDHVHPDYNALAGNSFGEHFLFHRVPRMFSGGVNLDSNVRCAETFASFKPGNCDWQDSLIVRPGYEGETK